MRFVKGEAGPARRAVVVSVTMASALLFVAGCGSSSKGSGALATASVAAPSSGVSSAPVVKAAAQPGACSLLTPAEAEAAAGTPLVPPVAAGGSAGHETLCQFIGPTTGPTVQLEVYVGDGAKKQLDIERVELKHTFTTLPGIGDQCVQEQGWIFVEKDGIWASLRLVRLDDPSLHVIPLQTAAKALAGRLP